MTAIRTLRERRERERDAFARAVSELTTALRQYARAHGGRFILFGSAARGDYRPDSDVDILVDFPAEQEQEASLFAEEQCWARNRTPDVRPIAYCGPELLARVRREGIVME